MQLEVHLYLHLDDITCHNMDTIYQRFHQFHIF